WMTDHSVYAVGTPLLTREVKELGPDERLFARLRAPGPDDVALTAAPGRTTIELASPDGQATLETDAAARVLLLWRRRPADPPASAARRGPTRSGGCADYSAATDSDQAQSGTTIPCLRRAVKNEITIARPATTGEPNHTASSQIPLGARGGQ